MEEVRKKIGTLNRNKSAGPDMIRPELLLELIDQLSLPLTLIFRQSLATGKLPQDWKIANSTPIFKKGSKADVSNYRPISLTSVPGKLLEGIIRDRIVEHLNKFKLLRNSQHGFRNKRSCNSNLILFWDSVTRYIDNGIPVDTIYLDLSKGFDTVPHIRS